MKKFTKNPYIWVFIAYLAMFIFIPLGLKFALYSLGVGETKGVSFADYHTNSIISLTMNTLILLIIFAYICVLYQKTSLFQWRKPIVKGKDFLYAVYAVVGSKLIAIVFVVIMMLYYGVDHLEFSSRNQGAVEELIYTSYIAMIPVIILAPIIEEFFFRKMMIGHIFSSHKYVGLIISSLLFGGMHVVRDFTVMGLITYSTIGFCLGLVYIKTNRLEAAIIAHGFNNLLAFLLILIGR